MAGLLAVACLPGFGVSHLPGFLTKFLQNRPDVRLTLKPDRPERILEWKVDIGITDTDGFEGHPERDSTRIDTRTVCIFPEASPLAQLAVIRPRELIGQQLIQARREATISASYRSHVPRIARRSRPLSKRGSGYSSDACFMCAGTLERGSGPVVLLWHARTAADAFSNFLAA